MERKIIGAGFSGKGKEAEKNLGTIQMENLISIIAKTGKWIKIWIAKNMLEVDDNL